MPSVIESFSGCEGRSKPEARDKDSALNRFRCPAKIPSMRLVVAVVLGLAVCSACSDRRPPPAGGLESDGGARDSTTRPDVRNPTVVDGAISCSEPIDVVFVIDVSTSMAGELAAIREGIGRVHAAATSLTPDTQFGLVVFVDDAFTVNDCRPFESLEAMRAEFDSWRAFCASDRNPGSSGNLNYDCPENSLDAMYLAATRCPWRAGSTHVLIHVTDDTFRESPAVFERSRLPATTTYSQVASILVANKIRVGAFNFSGAGNCPTTRTSAGQGFFESYNSMPALPVQTHGRAWDLREVRAGRLNMAAAISDLVAAVHCTIF